jgi:hypothetical protein
MRIVSEKRSARYVDFLDDSTFIEVCITDWRKVVEVCIAAPRLGQLLLRQSKLAILYLELELMNVKLPDKITVHSS